jgi:hypothetical protein
MITFILGFDLEKSQSKVLFASGKRTKRTEICSRKKRNIPGSNASIPKTNDLGQAKIPQDGSIQYEANDLGYGCPIFEQA